MASNNNGISADNNDDVGYTRVNRKGHNKKKLEHDPLPINNDLITLSEEQESKTYKVRVEARDDDTANHLILELFTTLVQIDKSACILSEIEGKIFCSPSELPKEENTFWKHFSMAFKMIQ